MHTGIMTAVDAMTFAGVFVVTGYVLYMMTRDWGDGE